MKNQIILQQDAVQVFVVLVILCGSVGLQSFNWIAFRAFILDCSTCFTLFVEVWDEKSEVIWFIFSNFSGANAADHVTKVNIPVAGPRSPPEAKSTGVFVRLWLCARALLSDSTSSQSFSHLRGGERVHCHPQFCFSPHTTRICSRPAWITHKQCLNTIIRACMVCKCEHKLMHLHRLLVFVQCSYA